MRRLVLWLLLCCAPPVAAQTVPYWKPDGGQLKPITTNTSAGTGGIGVSSGTTGQRPGTPGKTIRWNTTTSKYELYDGAAWQNPVYESGLGTGVGTWLATPSSANLRGALTDETGTGAAVFADSPTLVTPALGTPSALTLTNATGLPISGISSLGTGVDTWLATPSSANLRGALTDETGTGAAVFADSPTLVTPALGTPSALTLTNATGLPISGLTASTSTAIGVGSVELGHATDTTLARDSAGRAICETFGVVVALGDSTVTTSETTTSASATDLTTTQHITFTLGASRKVEFDAVAVFSNSTVNALCGLTIDVDGTDYTNTFIMPVASNNTLAGNKRTLTLSSGAHTIKLQFNCNAGTLTASQRCIVVKGL